MKKVLILLLAFSFAFAKLNAQDCPANPTYLNKSGTYALSANRSLVLKTDATFTVTVQTTFASTATICVLNGAKLNLSFSNINTIQKGGVIYIDSKSSVNLVGSSISNFPLTIINDGEFNQTTSVNYTDGAMINNNGTYTSTNPIIFNSGAVTLNNNGYFKFTSTMNFNTGTFAINNSNTGDIDFGINSVVLSNTTLYNAGTVTIGGDLTIQGLSVINNSNYINLKSNSKGLIIDNATINNKGVVEVTGEVLINAAGTLTNNCTISGKSNFTNNGTVNNNKDILVTKSTFLNQGTLVNGANALIQGANFTNNSSVTGKGNFYFSGQTTNSGVFKGIGGTINFYDATRSSANFFDVQNTKPTNTTKNAIVPNTASVFTTCADLVAPVITSQPSLQVLCSSAITSATFSVTATSTNTQTYQWYKNGVAINGAVAINSSYIANGLTLADTANVYTVVVTNEAGSTTSNPAFVKYVILSQPAPTSLYIATGSAAAFAIKATASTSIQWQFNTVNIIGATAATYSDASAALTDAGSYKAIVTYNGVACTTDEAILKVENLPVISKQPTTQVFCSNAITSAKLSVDATSTSTATFQWYKNGAAITGATAKDLNLNNLTLADTANTYYAIATNGVGTAKSNTASVKYLILSQPTPATQTLVTGAAATFVMKASAGTSIQWLFENVTIPGATAATYTDASAALTDAGKYKATVTYNGVTCTTDDVVLKVENLPIITKQPATQVLCSNAITATKLSVDANSASSLSFQWYKNGIAITGATAKDLNLNNLTLADTANTYYVIATNAVGTAKSNNASVKFLILSQPAPATLNVVIGSSASFTLKASAGTTIQWLFENNNILAATASSFTKPAVLPTDAGKYKATVTYNGVACTTDEAVLIVENPLAIIVAQPAAVQSFCSPATNTSATFSVVTTSPSAVSYQWYKKDAAIAGATASTFTATGLTMADTANPFKVVITNAAGKVTSNNAYIKYVIVAQPSPATQLVATGNTVSFNLKTSGASSLLWMKNNATLNSATASILQLPVVNYADSGSYKALVTYPGGTCTTDAAVLKTSVVLYSRKDGDLNKTDNWGVATDGSGSTPVDFLRSEHTFVIANRTTAKTGGTLTIAGTLDLADANLTIEDGRSLTVGRIIRSGSKGVLSSTLKDSLFISGIAPSDLYFDSENNTIQRLTINGSTVALHTPLNIANNNGDKPNNNGILQVNGGTFYTSDMLTLKSDKNGTGSIGNSAGTIVGKVTIEKFINNKRSWRLMGAPVNANGAQTINAAYQEGAKSSTDNPVPGFGTHITYGAIANGFDQNPQKTFSMKVYNSSSAAWVGVPATNKTLVTDYPAYMLFIRGNRSYPITSTSSKTPATSTVLRVTGNVNQGEQTAKTISATGVTLVVNPYACPVNFTKIKSASTNLKARIRMWDPQLSGTNGTGGWVTVDGTSGTYRATPPSNLLTLIQAGQGFFVESADGANSGSMIISENTKDLTSITTSADKEGEDLNLSPSLEVNLRVADTAGTTAIADGVLFNFNETANNGVDKEDAFKIWNFSDNLSILEGSSYLTIDQRKAPVAGDSLKLSLNHTKTADYQLEFVPASLDNQALALYDKYLNKITSISLTDTTRYKFSINLSVTASKAPDRFVIVAQKTTPIPSVLPVTFTGIKAYAKDKAVTVEWTVKGEQDIAYYEVETSTKGNNFSKAGMVAATGATVYSFTDAAPAAGINYYRVKSVGKEGEVRYTGIVNVNMETAAIGSAVSIYPNPLNGPSFTLTMTNMAAGSYNVAVTSQHGATLYSSKVTHSGGTASQKVTMNRPLANGIYYLTTTATDGTTKTIKVTAAN